MKGEGECYVLDNAVKGKEWGCVEFGQDEASDKGQLMSGPPNVQTPVMGWEPVPNHPACLQHARILWVPPRVGNPRL